MRSSNINYLPQVDHLRALAAVWIVLYHGGILFEMLAQYGDTAVRVDNWPQLWNPFHALLREGHVAVSLFMVLSGFIFTYGAYGKRVRYAPFVANRLLRIYPLYVVLILFFVTLQPGKYSLLHTVATVLPLADLFGVPEIVPMSWAVAVEFQFYLLFPLLLAHLNKHAVKTLFAVIAAALLLRVLGVGLWANPRDMSYAHLVGRIDQFVLGMGAAVVVRGGVQTPRTKLIAATLCVIGVIFGFHLLGGYPPSANWKILWPTIEGLIFAGLIVAYVSTPMFWPKAVDWSLRKVGELSFSIYLLHTPLIYALAKRPQFLLRFTGDDFLNGVISAVLLVLPALLVFSHVTYHVIEKPFLSMRVRYLVEDDESIRGVD
jgi:peptidoglycan/LPS O-acetylase OafA/YrhL